jgi:hypothetical protein
MVAITIGTSIELGQAKEANPSCTPMNLAQVTPQSMWDSQ